MDTAEATAAALAAVEELSEKDKKLIVAEQAGIAAGSGVDEGGNSVRIDIPPGVEGGDTPALEIVGRRPPALTRLPIWYVLSMSVVLAWIYVYFTMR